MKRGAPWNKGFTKDSHPSVAKISKTLKRKDTNNFSGWMIKARQTGLIPASYPAFRKNEDLAFLIGMILGDGHIDKFERTELLQVTLGTDKPELWHYTSELVRSLFEKEPTLRFRESKCVDIRLYQKFISRRFGIPHGARGRLKLKVPSWIARSHKFTLAYLRGLFEAEASLSIHNPTYTYNLSFSNRNESLLDIVENLLSGLGFHPERRWNAVRLRKKLEVLKFVELIGFRTYPSIAG